MPTSSAVTQSHNDISRKSDTVKRPNTYTDRPRYSKHPWNKQYNSVCLIKGCKEVPHYDEKANIHWSVCTHHMEALEFGKWRKKL